MAKELKTIRPKNTLDWRKWLEKNHAKEQAVWIVCSRKNASRPTLTHDEAVNEALCFGWIDSKANKLHDEHYLQTFTRRKPTSVWSKISKAKVAMLKKKGLMMEAGLKSIAIAKKNGSWTKLDEVEKLQVPSDLQAAFKANPRAEKKFHSLARSNKKLILQKLMMAKREETRIKRIEETMSHLAL